MREGPCLLIYWKDSRVGPDGIVMLGRFFPPKGMTARQAEVFAQDWLYARDGDVVRVSWAWGEVPKGVARDKVVL